MNKNKRSIYLGDDLYAEDQGYQYRLFAHDSITTYNEVFLDREMLEKLVKWSEK